MRDSFRLGLQSAVAAALCFLLLNMIGSDEAFVGVLSAVLIVQPSIGRTITAGWERLLATLLGCAVGLVCLFLLPNGYGAVIALALVMFVMNFIAGFRPNWRYGVVAAVALALADTSGNLELAQARSLAIGIGIAVGIGVSFVVWPESAAKRGLRHRRNALQAVADRFEAALQEEKDDDQVDQARRTFHRSLSSGREVIGKAKTSDTGRLKRTFDALEELYNSVILLARVDSPLSYFEGKGPDRCDVIDSGRAAILSLTEDGNKVTEDVEAFVEMVERLETGLSDHNIEETNGTYAASVIFGLNEMKRCLINFCERNNRRKSDRSPLQKLSPV